VYDPVITGFCIIGAYDCCLCQLADMVKGESLVKALGDGTSSMVAAILFACQTILFHMVHHEASNVLI